MYSDIKFLCYEKMVELQNQALGYLTNIKTIDRRNTLTNEQSNEFQTQLSGCLHVKKVDINRDKTDENPTQVNTIYSAERIYRKYINTNRNGIRELYNSKKKRGEIHIYGKKRPFEYRPTTA